jgi:hypothetical protein
VNVLGWIVTGKVPALPSSVMQSSLGLFKDSVLSFFVSKANQQFLEEFKAEEHFQATFSRNAQGRFVVRLPLAQGPQLLVDSFTMAQKRFFNLKRRFVKRTPHMRFLRGSV